ncbi:type II toxin-antitoxin system VapB family antitoxin [Methylobacterium sp. J-067]|uniref:type II toxin-antitoxin system VapB family antitoxin n=1 Tax=Methylobacterium sp. J-067 TaxID=2836648 RepID=UPI001FBAD8B1|nr:type II toxin-antitoxin system VapB family antitoxin [Methylobacterium sp. J-067]MCJ2025063.1 type II toxin-antitoxin system VapB family antitoxin [Methylobacterium sp. J-067]
MPLTIASDEVDQLAEKLASRTGVSKAEAVRVALVNELARQDESLADFLDRIKPIQDALAAYPKSGLKADKAFYDSLYED